MFCRFLLCVALPFIALGCATTPEENWARSMMNGVLWAQTSEEYAGVTQGAYRAAATRLDEALADPTWTAIAEQQGQADLAALPPAIILDVDETVLDNYPYEAWLVKNNGNFDLLTWNRWIADAQAKAIPGAPEFIAHAVAKGVKVFYVTNRDYAFDVDMNDNGKIDADEKNVPLENFTIKNLQTVGLLPEQAGLSSGDALLLKGEKPEWGSDKTTRRMEIASKYRVLLLLGDSLIDFIGYSADGGKTYGDYYKLEAQECRASLSQYDGYWGMRWIAISNATYGSWEQAAYKFDRQLPASERENKKMEHLRSWK